MKLLISNALIVPMTQEGTYFRGDIGIDGKHIVFVGEADPGFVADRIIDGSFHIAMPALVNAHTHLSMGLMRNYKDDLPTLQAWLGEIFPIEDKLTEKDILIASRLGLVELIQSGVTTFADMYFHPQASAEAVLETGLRASISITLFGSLEENKTRVFDRERLLSPYVGRSEGRIQVDCAPHAIYTCPKETYQFAHSWAKDHQAILHTHLSETMQEVQDCLKETGKTPLQYLLDCGVLKDVKSLLAHCVHLTDTEVELLKGLDSTIVHNPSSNCKLSSGIAPISTYFQKGISVALGTDGASSNNNLNMFEEMHVASLLGKVYKPTGYTLHPYEVLSMATVNGAKALGLEKKIGQLKAGMEADILLVNTHASHLTPLNDPFSALVYATQASDVDTLLCQGRILMEGRKVMTIDEDQVIKDAQKSWAEVQQR
ncbi:amidohydrolase [Sphaerochaeta globosa]|uniref:5-methylthioadenosine/S-adenosylhomocysteine deaminase n=1 Tax=Sphaerochaeta globosa (strain ATCC BAA-1886 / DSM 22777 / Buddy) TaxID=158189 RepID=F0RWY5_SPHGB|nr:amidohydrolase [Sphaerochaeta globosa]ADY13766.1 5-methylthioadenosine/S-adenosylhomocysteine deaminase [Sphaerochaeta globosa str. Buddy]